METGFRSNNGHNPRLVTAFVRVCVCVCVCAKKMEPATDILVESVNNKLRFHKYTHKTVIYDCGAHVSELNYNANKLREAFSVDESGIHYEPGEILPSR